MRAEIIERLLDINREFYQTFSDAFAESRQRPQPGILQSCSWIMQGENVLELGCGHGQLPRTLHEEGFAGFYLGLDSSSPLLEFARQAQLGPRYRFLEADLTRPDWIKKIKGAQRGTMEKQPKTFDQICAFAFLHHIPGATRRQDLLAQIVGQLHPSGQLTLSNWNFLHSTRLQKRILLWEEVGLSQDEVEQGDYLLDWRRGGLGYRYVHHFTRQELTDLAHKVGCRVMQTFYSDGEAGKLGLYQVWQPMGSRQ